MITPAIYLVDWIAFSIMHTPTFLRKQLIEVFLLSVFKEIESLHGQFFAKRKLWLYQIAHTSQVVHIEKVLNDAFDNELRRIYISNVDFTEYSYLYPPDDDRPIYLAANDDDPYEPLFLLENMATAISPDATVHVPLEYEPLELEYRMRFLVDYYKTYGTTYEIVYYE